eukprot:9170410-Pyramimonas_sp.AAC.1
MADKAKGPVGANALLELRGMARLPFTDARDASRATQSLYTDGDGDGDDVASAPAGMSHPTTPQLLLLRA